MPSEQFEAIFRRDLDRLPGLADNEWVPTGPRRHPQLIRGSMGRLTALALVVIVVGLGLRAVRGDQISDGGGAEAIRPTYIASAPNAEPPPGTTLVASNALTGAPVCPASQTPWLVVSFSAGPADGSPSAEAAFRKAHPAATEFTMYLWSVSQPVRGDDPRITGFVPIWIVAEDKTFLVVTHRFGPATETNTVNRWFAYPAKFAGCITGAPGPTGFPSR